MCFQIITQELGRRIQENHEKGVNAYTLVYLPGAWALTDPPKTFGELLA